MENINDIFKGDGMPPTFTAKEMAVLKKRADAAKVRNIENQAKGITVGMYDLNAYVFALAYYVSEEPWALMTKKQREFILRIKDGVK